MGLVDAPLEAWVVVALLTGRRIAKKEMAAMEDNFILLLLIDGFDNILDFVRFVFVESTNGSLHVGLDARQSLLLELKYNHDSQTIARNTLIYLPVTVS